MKRAQFKKQLLTNRMNMKIKAGLMFSILISFIWCNICKAASTEDEALGEALQGAQPQWLFLLKACPA